MARSRGRTHSDETEESGLMVKREFEEAVKLLPSTGFDKEMIEAAVARVRAHQSEGAARTLREIAEDIFRTWPPVRAREHAEPYMKTMRLITSVSDKVGIDDGRHVVLHFLANATGWKGPDARRVKKELRGLLDDDRLVEEVDRVLSGKQSKKGPARFARSKIPRHG